MNCPICNTKMAHWEDRMDSTLMEEEHSCLNHYHEHFLTGYHERAIRTSDGWQIFQWSYTTPLEEVEAIKAEIEAAIAMAKILIRFPVIRSLPRIWGLLVKVARQVEGEK